jgi:UDP-glucose 4-epimerase
MILKGKIMNILVTGGAGFIGSHLCDALLASGHSVVALDNLSLGREENVSHNIGNPSFSFVRGDILDEAQLDGLFLSYQFDMVYHLAANSDIARSYTFPATDLESTFLTTFRVLDAMRRHSVGRILFASTSAVYGDVMDVRLAEGHGPLIPVSHYGAAKLASEAFISSFVANYGLQAWIVRFPNVVGERATHGVIFDFINKLRANPEELEVLGDGEQCKPYQYVRDLVGALLFVREHTSEAFNVFNIGVESATKVVDIARMVISEMGLDARIRFTGGERGWVGDVPRFDYDLAKIHTLGWRASKTSDESVLTAIRHILGKEAL